MSGSRDLQGVFFDMDGTLLDWQVGMEESWAAACGAALPQLLPGIAADRLLAAIREKREWFWAHPVHRHEGRMDLDRASRVIVTEALTSIGLDAPDITAAIATDYRARRDACICLYDGAVEVLESMKQRGLKMALITNGNAISQRRCINRFALTRYFDCIVIEGEFGVGKPDERVFRHALASCAVEPARTWMIGDNLEADIVTPHRLGMHTIWVDESGVGVPADADAKPHRIVRHVRELLDE